MNFLQKAFFTGLTLAVCLSAMASADNQKYSRIVQTIENKINTPLNPIDANHEQAITLGLYTQEQVDALDVAAWAVFNAKYGIDFSTGVTVLPNGVRLKDLGTGTGGLVTWFPYILGADEVIKLTQDTKYPERAKSGEWFSLQVGSIIIFSEDFLAPGGTNVGAQIFSKSLFFDGDINLLESRSNWSKKSNREIIKLTSYQLGQRTPSQWNIVPSELQFIQSFEAFDRKGRQGFGVSGTVYIRIPEVTGTTYIQTIDTFFWEKNDA